MMNNYDHATEAVFVGHALYDPNSRRFITPDSYIFERPEMCEKSPVECNDYSYAVNNPLKYHDPSGNFGLIGAAIGAVAGGIGGYMTSGDWKGAVVGAVAGAAVGAVVPTGGASATAGQAAASAFASGFGGSVIGQAGGNAISGKEIGNINYVMAAGAGLGAATAGALGSGAIAPAFTSKALGVITQGTVEGLFTGAGELGGQKASEMIDQGSNNDSGRSTNVNTSTFQIDMMGNSP